MDLITADGGTAGGWKVTDTNESGQTPSPLDAASFGEAIALKQREMDDKGTMTSELSNAYNTKWYAIEKDDNLWSMTEQHLEKTWGRSVTDEEVATYWQKVCEDNPFINDNIIQPGEVVAFRDPGADPRNPAGTGAQIDEKAAAKDPALKGDLNTYFGSLEDSEKGTAAFALLGTTKTKAGRQAVVEAYLTSLEPDQRAAAAAELKGKYPTIEAPNGQGHDGHLTDADKLNNDMAGINDKPGIIDEALAAANASS